MTYERRIETVSFRIKFVFLGKKQTSPYYRIFQSIFTCILFSFLQAKKINPKDCVKPIIMTSVTNNPRNLDPTVVDFKNITLIFKYI